jgi:hypothetical protein
MRLTEITADAADLPIIFDIVLRRLEHTRIILKDSDEYVRGDLNDIVDKDAFVVLYYSGRVAGEHGSQWISKHDIDKWKLKRREDGAWELIV